MNKLVKSLNYCYHNHKHNFHNFNKYKNKNNNSNRKLIIQMASIWVLGYWVPFEQSLDKKVCMHLCQIHTYCWQINTDQKFHHVHTLAGFYLKSVVVACVVYMGNYFLESTTGLNNHIILAQRKNMIYTHVCVVIHLIIMMPISLNFYINKREIIDTTYFLFPSIMIHTSNSVIL